MFYFAKEEPDCRFVPLFPEAFVPVRVPFQKGSGQKFRQPSGTGIDLGFFELDDLSKPSPGEDVFPLVISAETFPPHSTDEHIVEPTPDTSPRMQITQAVLEKNNGDHFQVRVIRQILWIDEVRYELREIYGIASSTVEGFDDNDPGKECVICMTEPKDTAVLPCRHMVRLCLRLDNYIERELITIDYAGESALVPYGRNAVKNNDQECSSTLCSCLCLVNELIAAHGLDSSDHHLPLVGPRGDYC